MGVKTNAAAGIFEIVLDWPAVRNAMGPAEAGALTLAFAQAIAGNDTVVILLRANGKAFCAGGNLAAIVALAEQGEAAVRSSVYGVFQSLFRTIADCPIPIIAAVDGPAIGLGCDLALAADLTFIGREGWLAQGWANVGLIPATGGTFYAKRRGGSQALWALLSATKLTGPDAQAAGLALATDDARAAARHAAETLAWLPREQVLATKALARIEEFDQHLAEALRRQIGYITSATFLERAKKFPAR